MKSDQFMSYPKGYNFITKFYKNYSLKLVPDFFVFSKSKTQPLLENEIFEEIFLY